VQFGYFTLSDNAYSNNTRTANQYILDIVDEAIHADKLGMNSTWIGEHHFSTLGCLSCPDIALAYVAAATKRIRLAPAVTVLPLHHPIRVAEQWATLDLLSGGRVDFACGRGYDRREYEPLGIAFDNNAETFAEGLEAVQRLWTETAPVTHKGKHYRFEDISLTPKPVQRPIPSYVACFSKPTVELAARLGLGVIVAPFAIAMQFGSMANFANLYRDECAKHGKKPGRMMCSYFLHFFDNPAEERAARERQIRYFHECGLSAIPGSPGKPPPPTYAYFASMKEKMANMRPEHLTGHSVLMGKATQIIDTLKATEAVGIEEVILYANVGLKPHQQTKDEMARFMEEVAPAFKVAAMAAR
jgi:alkanesulfonate monooxygenase SsuD/methylene tetrahydromethanopterin reductase-like flavin-dependent oxidoreductase (luciferase family)